jgi:hypothetical protein
MTTHPRSTLLLRARFATIGIVATAIAGTAALTAVAAASDGPSPDNDDDGTSEVPGRVYWDDHGSGSGVVPPTDTQSNQQPQGESHAS